MIFIIISGVSPEELVKSAGFESSSETFMSPGLTKEDENIPHSPPLPGGGIFKNEMPGLNVWKKNLILHSILRWCTYV